MTSYATSARRAARLSSAVALASPYFLVVLAPPPAVFLPIVKCPCLHPQRAAALAVWPCLAVFLDMDGVDIFIVTRHYDLSTPCHTRPPSRLAPAAEQQHARHSLINLVVVFNTVETLLCSTRVSCLSECVTGLLDLAVGWFTSATVYPTSAVTLLFSPWCSLPTLLPGETSLFLSYSLNRG
jgi:hypothetical protein